MASGWEIGLTGAVLAIEAAAYAIYAHGIVRGRIVPSRATWLIWAPLLWLTVASSVAAGTEAALVKTLATAVGVSVIAVLALRYGTGGWSTCDRACFAVTALGLAGWALSADPVVALALFILADATGAVPTIRDLLRDPRREQPAYWLLCGVTSALALALIEPGGWSLTPCGFAQWSYAAYLLLVNTAVLLAMAGRPAPRVRPVR